MSTCSCRYGNVGKQRYDPYFYQQRDGGGPERHDRRYDGASASAATTKKDTQPRKYKGPNIRYRSPARKENERDNPSQDSSLGLDDHEPLTFPDDAYPPKGFLEDTPKTRSRYSEDLKTPEAERGLFSPEDATPGSSKQRRRSKMRYEPY